MFAIIGAILFAVAAILHLSGVNELVLTFALFGAMCYGLHLAGLWPFTLHRG